MYTMLIIKLICRYSLIKKENETTSKKLEVIINKQIQRLNGFPLALISDEVHFPQLK